MIQSTIRAKRFTTIALLAALLGILPTLAHAQDNDIEQLPLTGNTEFNSQYPMAVIAIVGNEAQQLGVTPAETDIQIPRCTHWFVVPGLNAPTLKVCQEVYAQGVPGLGVGIATDADLEHIGELTSLKSLVLPKAVITDAGLAELRGLTQLQYLEIDAPHVTDAGLVHLADMDSLKQIILCGTPITDAGLVHLAGLANLKTLRLDGTDVTAAGLERLSGMTGLWELKLDTTRYTDEGLRHIANMTEMRTLNMKYAPITDAGLEHLAGLTQLEQLDIAGTRITPAGVEHLAGLTNLNRLIIDPSNLTDESLEHLSGMNQLRTLRLNKTGITDVGMQHIAGMTGLRQIDLSNTYITDAGLAYLTNISSLTMLDLSDAVNITDKGLALDLATGKILWSGTEAVPSYTTLLPLPEGNPVTASPALVIQTCRGLNVVAPDTGQSLLAVPPELLIDTPAGRAEIRYAITGRRTTNTYVELMSEGKADGFVVRGTTRIEFDGFMWFEVEVSGQGSTKLSTKLPPSPGSGAPGATKDGDASTIHQSPITIPS